MSYGNHGGQPKRGGSGIMFLVMLLVGGFFIMNFLRTQGSVDRGSQMPDDGQPRGGYVDDNYGPPQINRPAAEPKGGIYGEGQAERPATHRDANDWDMQEVNSQSRKTSGQRRPVTNQTEQGDWSIEEVPTDAKQEPRFNLSNPAEVDTPSSKSTKSGDWELEEINKK